MFNPMFNPEFNILTKALAKAGFFVLAAGFFAAPPSAGAGAAFSEGLTPAGERAWAMKILRDRLKRGGSESDAVQESMIQMRLAFIAFSLAPAGFSSEVLMAEEASSALRELRGMAAELAPEAQRELFRGVSRQETSVTARLAALEILRESQKAGNFSDELARFAALEAARVNLKIKPSEGESRLTALLFDIVSGLSEPSLDLQKGLAMLAVSKNPYSKPLPLAALGVLSRSGYNEDIAETLARGLESLIVSPKMQMLIAEDLAEKHFSFAESFLAGKAFQEIQGDRLMSLRALKKARLSSWLTAAGGLFIFGGAPASIIFEIGSPLLSLGAAGAAALPAMMLDRKRQMMTWGGGAPEAAPAPSRAHAAIPPAARPRGEDGNLAEEACRKAVL